MQRWIAVRSSSGDDKRIFPNRIHPLTNAISVPMADPTAATEEGVWRRQSRDAMTNSGRDRERGRREGGLTRADSFLSKFRVSGRTRNQILRFLLFSPIVVVHAVVVVFFFFPLSTSLVSNGIKWSPCPRRSPRRYWGRKASLGRWARHDTARVWQVKR